MSLTDEQQVVWDSLHGITDPTLKEYAERHPTKMPKYLKIQQALRSPKAEFQPVQAWRKGPGGTADKWEDGLAELKKFLPMRGKAVCRGLFDIEQALGETVYWGKITWVYRTVYTRYHQDVVMGADILIEGCANDAGSVNYYYDNTSHAEGAHRWAILNGKKVTFNELAKNN